MKTVTASILLLLVVLVGAASTPYYEGAAKDPSGGGGGGDSPGTSNLVAWYDFNDGGGNGHTDSHSTFDLAEGSPTYQSASSPEYGIASGASEWSQSDLGDSWHNEPGDWSFVVRVRWPSSLPSGNEDMVQDSTNNLRIRMRGGSSDFLIKIVGNNVFSAATATADTWHTIVCTWDSVAGEHSVSVDGETFVTEAVGGPVYSCGNITLPSSASAATHYDFVAFFSQALTQAQSDWLYNSGSSRNYGDL